MDPFEQHLLKQKSPGKNSQGFLIKSSHDIADLLAIPAHQHLNESPN